MDTEIRDWRKSLNLTQAELAEILGVAPFTIRRWESGKTRPSRMAQKLIDEVKAGLAKQQAKAINQALRKR